MLTFLAPCTLPLVPAYIAFIGGAKLGTSNKLASASEQQSVIRNAILYTIGFSVVFIVLGLLAGLGGVLLIQYRSILERLGGVLIIVFGLFMVGVFKNSYLSRAKHIKSLAIFKPGKPISSLLFGATFALGWTPCVGPVLGSVLILAAAKTTALQGATLLGVFSIGLAVPFLVVALAFNWVSNSFSKLSLIADYISRVGGVFLILIGALLLTGHLGVFTGWFYGLFSFFGLQEGRLLNYL